MKIEINIDECTNTMHHSYMQLNERWNWKATSNNNRVWGTKNINIHSGMKLNTRHFEDLNQHN